MVSASRVLLGHAIDSINAVYRSACVMLGVSDLVHLHSHTSRLFRHFYDANVCAFNSLALINGL